MLLHTIFYLLSWKRIFLHWYNWNVKEMSIAQNIRWFSKTWGLFSAPPLTGCVTINKLLNQFRFKLLLKWGQSVYHRVVRIEWEFLLAQKKCSVNKDLKQCFFFFLKGDNLSIMSIVMCHMLMFWSVTDCIYNRL